MRRFAIAFGCAFFGCQPEFNEDDALVTTARVLAVKSEPAEAAPGAPVRFTALVALPPSLANPSSPVWSFCLAPKPPTVDNLVSPACLQPASLLPAGEGPIVVAPTPSAACRLFGPNAMANGLRPRDPDVTGGYFQPLRVDLTGADPTFHLQRVLCGLSDASVDIASEFGHAYVPNENPHLAPVTATIAGEEADFSHIPAGARVELAVSWPAVDAENYAYFDRTAQTVTTHGESMRVSWHVSAGKLDTESTGRTEGDPSPTSSNVWLAPNTPLSVRLWIVLRDSRGGVDFAARELEVFAR